MKFLILITIAFSLAYSAYAAEITAFPNQATARAGDTFTITVMANPEDEPLNVIEGEIKIPDGIDVTNISTAGSALSIWAVRPTYVIGDRVIVFTGGTTAMIPSASVRLFTLTAKARIDGVYTFEPKAVRAYKNDGTGTEVSVRANAVSVEVSAKGASQPDIDSPALTPDPLVAEIGSDPSLFGGKYFVAFYGGDSGKGVAYYEIIEGDADPVRVNNLYVLRDQSQNFDLEVRAVASDGTYVSTKLGEKNWPVSLMLLLLLSLLLIAFLLYLFIKKKRS